MQKVVLTHDTPSASLAGSFCIRTEEPFHCSTSVAVRERELFSIFNPTASQKVADTQETLPSAPPHFGVGADRRVRAPVVPVAGGGTATAASAAALSGQGRKFRNRPLHA